MDDVDARRWAVRDPATATVTATDELGEVNRRGTASRRWEPGGDGVDAAAGPILVEPVVTGSPSDRPGGEMSATTLARLSPPSSP